MLAVELYLGLQRLILRHKVKKWRNPSFDVPKRQRHDTFKPLIAPILYDLLIELCGFNAMKSTDSKQSDTVNALYDDIGRIHHETALQNTKTRVSYLKEPYVLGEDNVSFRSSKTQQHFECFQDVSHRQGLSTDNNPFSKFTFSVDIDLLLAQKRSQCAYCGKRSHLYCPYCKIPFPIEISNELAESSNSKMSKSSESVNSSNLELAQSAKSQFISFPKLTLPVNVDIIRHPKETVNVCSSVHSCIMAPDNVQMYEFPNVPPLSKEEGVYLLYPSESATFLDEMDLSDVRKIVVIESRWRGNTPIYEHKELKALPHCKIRNRETLYWRFQEKSKEYLATIEAIYYGVVDCWRAKNKGKEYEGQFDDLLLLYAQNHAKIKGKKSGAHKFWHVGQ